jgi:hypothetical protein
MRSLKNKNDIVDNIYMSYYDKYVKYKTKYLKMKNQINTNDTRNNKVGGDRENGCDGYTFVV